MKEGKKIEKTEKEEDNPAEEFLDWVVETAEKNDNYEEFYKQAQHKYLDFLIEGKNIDAGGLITQFTVWGETFKIAIKDNPPLKEFTDNLYKESVDMQKKFLEEKTKQEAPDHYDERKIYNKLHKDLGKKIYKMLEQYKSEVGDYKALEALREYEKILRPLSYASGELAIKMTELEEKRDINVSNKINYGATNLFANVHSVIQKMRPKMKVEAIRNKEFKEAKEEMKKLFG